MDFITGIEEIEADTYVVQIWHPVLWALTWIRSYDEPPPRNKLEAFWQWLVSTKLFAVALTGLRTLAFVDVMLWS